MNNESGGQVMDWRKLFEGSAVCIQGNECDGRIPSDDELLNHTSVEVVLKTFKARKVEQSIYSLREITTYSTILSWPIEYEILGLEDYAFDVRIFWSCIYGKESLSQHPKYVESMKMKARMVGGVQKRDKWDLLKKNRNLTLRNGRNDIYLKRINGTIF